MTDLKPEDLVKLREIAEMRSRITDEHAASGRSTTAKEFASAFTPDVCLSLLADRARMEKALRDLAERLPIQVQATRGYLLQNGLDAHFADVLLSHYLDFAREAGEAVGASQ